MNWEKEYNEKLRSADEAVKLVKDGDVVHIGTSSSIAYKLAEALYKRKDEFENVTISSGVTTRILPFYKEEAKGHFSILTYFAGPAERMAMKYNNCRYTSRHLSQIDSWIAETLKPTVAFIEVSKPDEYGFMSYGAFGTSMHDLVREKAATIILQVNEQAPYVYGRNNLIHVSQADAIVEADDKIEEFPDMPADDTVNTISEYIVNEIPDGATIQLGLGGVSGAVGYGLCKKKDLGVHSEMLTNSMMHLMELGVINNKKKTFMPGKSVAAFAMGTRDLYDYIHKNPQVYMGPYTFVNNPYIIAKNDNFMSVNTAMSVDLFGQVAADSIGGKQQSAVGGQVDFVRGAQLSKGGKSFIALPSTLENKKGRSSKIVASFPTGTAVTTSRQDVHYVVTEYGCVNLRELSAEDRAKALISLAHPDYREELMDQAKQLGLIRV